MSYSPDVEIAEFTVVTPAMILCEDCCNMQLMPRCVACQGLLNICHAQAACDRTVHISHSLHLENMSQQKKGLLPAARHVHCVCGVGRTGSLEAGALMRKLLPLL